MTKRRTQGPAGSRSERTRSALVRAAHQTFADVGFHAAKITDIADLANVSYGSFYTYFPSKEAVFLEVLDAVLDDLFAGPLLPVSVLDAPAAAIDAANRSFLRRYRDNGRIIESLDRLAASDPTFSETLQSWRHRYVAGIAGTVETWREHGLAAPSEDVAALADVLAAMLERFAYLSFVGQPSDEETAIRALNAVYERAFGVCETHRVLVDDATDLSA